MEPAQRLPHPPTAEPTVAGDLFKAWFTHAYAPMGPFREALLAIGVDPDNLQKTYPGWQFAEAAKIIRQFAHARLDDQAAFLEIGRSLARAFFLTPSGRLLGMVLRIVPSRTMLHRVPAYMRIARTNVRIETADLPDGGVRLEITDPDQAPPWVLVGSIDEGLQQTGTRAKLTMEPLAAGRIQVDARWG